MHTWIGYAHPDRLISYPDARYLSACSLPIRVRIDAWELPTHGRGDQSQHLTAVLHELRSGLQPGRGTKLSPLSLLAAKTGQNSPRSACSQPKRDKTLPACAKRPKMRVFWRAGRILSRKHPQPATPGEFCHGIRSTAAVSDEFRLAISCAAAR